MKKIAQFFREIVCFFRDFDDYAQIFYEDEAEFLYRDKQAPQR